MKRSPPKVVKIDLNQYNKQYNTSPHKKYSSKLQNQSPTEFSFSNEHKKQPSTTSFTHYKQKKSSNSPKPPFKFSPIKPYDYHSSSSKEKSKSKYRNDINQHFEKINERDRLFKNSTQKLKDKFFNKSERKKLNEKQLTKKTLQEIGKYAVNRSKEKSNNEDEQKLKLSNKKDIKVQYYGFNNKKHAEFQKEYDSLNKKHDNSQKVLNKAQNYQDKLLDSVDNFVKFQKSYNQQLESNENRHNLPNGIKNASSKYSKLTNSPSINAKSATKKTYQFSSITQEKISLMLQIFQFCDKGQQGDKLIVSDFYNLLAELQRLYLIKVIQQSQRSHYKTQSSLSQAEYQQLLNKFEQQFKIIFYRKTTNNIYDAIFYLSQDNKLDTICQIYLKIKRILSI